MSEASKKFIGWLFTPLYVVNFISILVIFDPFIRLGFLLGPKKFRLFFDLLNLALIINFKLIGTKIKFYNCSQLPSDKPLIIISNHQSMYDIPIFSWYLRRYVPRFISKKELGSGIPSISFSLRKSYAALIDRSDPKQAIPEIERFAIDLSKKKHSAVIFPEGTRARDGKLKKFKTAGLKTLLKAMPDAVIVPASIKGSWEMVRYKLLPVPFGTRIEFRVHTPILRGERSIEDIITEAENIIRADLESLETMDEKCNIV